MLYQKKLREPFLLFSSQNNRFVSSDPGSLPTSRGNAVLFQFALLRQLDRQPKKGAIFHHYHDVNFPGQQIFRQMAGSLSRYGLELPLLVNSAGKGAGRGRNISSQFIPRRGIKTLENHCVYISIFNLVLDFGDFSIYRCILWSDSGLGM